MANIPDLTDSAEWTREDLEILRKVVNDEIDRRLTIATSEVQMDQLLRQYSAATGRKDGDAWVQPTGAHDSYPARSIVTHNGKKWVSLIGGNVWEPGVSGWREHTAQDSVVFPEYLPPTGAHDAYKVGDRVTFRGYVYESVIDSNVYSPTEYAPGWNKLDSTGTVIPIPEEYPPVDEPIPVPVEIRPELPGEPEPEAPSVPAFVQPTGGHDAYKVGDRVLFEGSVYESAIDGNSWSPTGYPAGWKKI